MKLQPLPVEVKQMLEKLDAPQRLVAHLTLVHDVAVKIIASITEFWPNISFDKQAVLIGAATHDIGKVVYKDELSSPGKQHEEIGSQLLLENGIAEKYTRFASTHAAWEETTNLEDLLVTLADKIWKGKREEKLELSIAKQIASVSDEEVWEVYIRLDDIINAVTKDADERLNWQMVHPI